MTSIPSCGAHIIDLQVVVSLHLRTTPWRTQKRAAPEEGIETAEAHMLNIPYAYLNLPYLTLPYLGRLPIGRTFLCLSEDSPGLSVCLPPLYETQLLPLARAARPRATLWLLAEPMGLNTKPLPSCVVNRLERKFQALIVAVFATDGLLLPGSIVDAGAKEAGLDFRVRAYTGFRGLLRKLYVKVLWRGWVACIFRPASLVYTCIYLMEKQNRPP